MASSAWDPRYGLPLVPRHNNPWIYLAFAFLCVKRADGLVPDHIMVRAREHLDACMPQVVLPVYPVPGQPPPSFFRWPDGSGGDFSHDEMLGAAWLFPEFAHAMSLILIYEDGVYSNGELAFPGDPRKNQFRFPFLMPFLRQCSGVMKVSIVSQVIWSLYALASAALWKGECSGTLKVWLMADRMRELPISGLAVRLWAWWMESHHKMSPRRIFKENYLTEEPVFAEIAPDRFLP
jgi:hypothetical protein